MSRRFIFMGGGSYVLAHLVLLSCLNQSFGQDIPQVRLTNTINEQVSVWIQTEVKQWVRPELYMPRRGSVGLNLATEGKYYIVLRDNVNRDTHIGWIDFHKIARVPKAELLIDQFFVTEKFTYTVTIPVTVSETRKEIVYQTVAKEVEYTYKVRLPDGTVETRVAQTTVFAAVPVEREVIVMVTRSVSQQREATRTVARFGMKIRIGQKIQTLEEFFQGE
jgi:hypothetical protein